MLAGSALPTLFGSETRARTLAVLANATRPLTGYRIAEIARRQRIKVNAELAKLLAIGVVKAEPLDGDRRGWVIVDPDFRKFLQRNLRLSWSEDLLGDPAGRIRRTRAIQSRLAAMPPIDLSVYKGWRPRNPRDYDRPPEKDRILARMGLRTSGRTRTP